MEKDAVLSRRTAPRSGAVRRGRCREWKAGFMIKRVCLGNNRQLYSHICKICREGGQRRCAALPVWKKEGWREDAPPDGLRRIAAQAVRGDNASKKRIHNRTKMIYFIRYNEV